MTLTQLHYVITIAETKSFNKAAEKLYVSQPSLTSAIKELEKELGISIFYRIVYISLQQLHSEPTGQSHSE